MTPVVGTLSRMLCLQGAEASSSVLFPANLASMLTSGSKQVAFKDFISSMEFTTSILDPAGSTDLGTALKVRRACPL